MELEKRRKALLKLNIKKYKISSQWEEPQYYEYLVNINGFKIKLCGLLAENKRSSHKVTASAGSTTEYPLERCYFELLERVSTYESAQDTNKIFNLENWNGMSTGEQKHEIIFPKSDDENHWRYSTSNGVALHKTRNQAKEKAFLELLERDRVLRSWYGHVKPQETKIIIKNTEDALLVDEYDIKAYYFEPSELENSEVKVSGYFMFPKKKGNPFVFGMGSSYSHTWALKKSRSECIQRLGFLWGEEIPEKIPVFTASPQYHQEYYLYRKKLSEIKRWLKGEHVGLSSINSDYKISVDKQRIKFIDLTPVEFNKKLFVMRACSDDAVPLVFGRAIKTLKVHESLEVHPIA